MSTTHITIEYDGGLDSELDEKLRELASTFGGKDVGSGCFLCEPFTRDVEFALPTDGAVTFEEKAKELVRQHMAARQQTSN